jgi:DNA-binding GntR family transcriptional regulator
MTSQEGAGGGPDSAAYQRILGVIRGRIADGRYPAGSRLPSLAGVQAEFGVGRTTSRKVYDVLMAEGLVISRYGSGYYVRPRVALRDTRRWYRFGTGSPYAAEQRAQGREPQWDWSHRIVPAGVDIAARLGIEPGQEVVESSYRFRSDGAPVLLSTSWEPRALTAGTPIELPEEGAHAGRGVLDRFAAIGLAPGVVTEKVTSRSATSLEAERLAVPAGSPVLEIERTHWCGSRAVETATLVAPQGYRAVYEIDVAPA